MITYPYDSNILLSYLLMGGISYIGINIVWVYQMVAVIDFKWITYFDKIMAQNI